jgi:hypothetical protein
VTTSAAAQAEGQQRREVQRHQAELPLARAAVRPAVRRHAGVVDQRHRDEQRQKDRRQERRPEQPQQQQVAEVEVRGDEAPQVGGQAGAEEQGQDDPGEQAEGQGGDGGRDGPADGRLAAQVDADLQEQSAAAAGEVVSAVGQPADPGQRPGAVAQGDDDGQQAQGGGGDGVVQVGGGLPAEGLQGDQGQDQAAAEPVGRPQQRPPVRADPGEQSHAHIPPHRAGRGKNNPAGAAGPFSV